MIGNTISNIRKEKNINQKEFAKNIKINVSYLSEIENNNRIPSLKLLKLICKELDLQLSKLLFLSLDRYTIENNIERYKNAEEIINKMLNVL